MSVTGETVIHIMMQSPKLSTDNMTYSLSPSNPPPKVKNFASFSNAFAAEPFSIVALLDLFLQLFQAPFLRLSLGTSEDS